MAYAQRLLQKGCQGYLYSMVSSSLEYLSTTDILVVHDFFEVFLGELSGMPINREIEFFIEVMPRTHSISKALYRMAPTELK